MISGLFCTNLLNDFRTFQKRCLEDIQFNIGILDLGDSSAASKKEGRKTGLRRTGIPATCEARTDLQRERREGLHMPSYDDEHTRANAFI